MKLDPDSETHRPAASRSDRLSGSGGGVEAQAGNPGPWTGGPPIRDREPQSRACDRGRYGGYTRARFQEVLARLSQRVYPDSVEAASIEVVGPLDRVPVAEAKAQPRRRGHVGMELGPMWATYGFALAFEVPADPAWAGARVDLHWNAHAEGLLFQDGRSVQGLNAGEPLFPGRYDAVLRQAAKPGERLTCWIEVACNGLLGEDRLPGKPPERAPRNPFFLEACALRRFDPEAAALFHDLRVLVDLEADREPPQMPRSIGGVNRLIRPALDTTWAGRLLDGINHACNLLDVEDPTTWPATRSVLAELLRTRNADCVHELSACGHAHIDTAWLWPIAETRRKCRRTFSTVCTLMERDPTLQFAASSAWQYEAIAEDDPDLFQRIRDRVDQGRWHPVGGTWIEPDCNLPSGESLCRQFLYGQAWFSERFGRRSRIFWNPDVFGYNGQLPQIMRSCGIDAFLTQKLSWNKFTAPLHHSFDWRGLDGSEVLTHFPPGDTYGAKASVEELRYHAANHKEADRTPEGYYLFGLGDGGGGPLPQMCETLSRVRDLQGVPRTQLRGPDAFFDRLREASLPVIEGELYFELHRGTFTSQAEIKRLNRRCEEALHDLELASAVTQDAPGDAERRAVLWKRLLLHQFHDILPGTSIEEVHRQTREELSSLLEATRRDTATRLRAYGETGHNGAVTTRWLNTLDVDRREVVTDAGGRLLLVEAEPFALAKPVEPEGLCDLEDLPDGGFRLSNSRCVVELDRAGRVSGLRMREDETAASEPWFAKPADTLLLLEDQPTLWDAWDVDPFAWEKPLALPPARLIHRYDNPMRCGLTFERTLPASGPAEPPTVVRQTFRLDADADALAVVHEVDWHLHHRLLKFCVPWSSRWTEATTETAFGATTRPTHRNTDADVARFEVPGHRWIHVGDAEAGLSLITDTKYGYAARDGLVTVSLLRGATYPDPSADAGVHRTTVWIRPHRGDWREAETPAAAAALNHPMIRTRLSSFTCPASLGPRSGRSLVLDTIKPAEDGDGVILRCYEAHGVSGKATLRLGRPAESVHLCNTLEDDAELLDSDANGDTYTIHHRPFQILSLRVRWA